MRCMQQEWHDYGITLDAMSAVEDVAVPRDYSVPASAGTLPLEEKKGADPFWIEGREYKSWDAVPSQYKTLDIDPDKIERKPKGKVFLRF